MPAGADRVVGSPCCCVLLVAGPSIATAQGFGGDVGVQGPPRQPLLGRPGRLPGITSNRQAVSDLWTCT